MTRLQTDFRDFLKLLNAHRVEFLLIGGYAVGYHGYPRATVDLDIWIGRTPDNASRVIAAQMDGITVPVIDLASLRKNKRAAGRYKDLDDLENLPEPADA